MKKAVARSIIFLFVASVLFSCSKEYSYENPLLNVVSKGTLKDSSGNCMPITVYGTYYDGVAPGDTNYVQVEVNVTAAGSYNISTDLQNGFQFTDSGYFKTPGLNTVILKSIGTPILNIPTNFTVSFDSTSCMFSVNVQDSTGTHLGGNGGGSDTLTIPNNSWVFTEGGHVYSGTIIFAEVATSIGTQLTIIGQVPSGTDTSFGLTLQSLTSSLDTGLYLTSQTGTNFDLTLTQSGDVIFAANSLTPSPILNIDLADYDITNKIVAGTFSGTASDFNGNTVLITNGAFKATTQ